MTTAGNSPQINWKIGVHHFCVVAKEFNMLECA
jgi:hypothetical protein